MPTLGARLWAGMAVLIALGQGCVYGEMRQVLRSHVASEMDCPEVHVEPRAPGYMRSSGVHPEWSDQYMVRGCGVVRVYSCPPDKGTNNYGSVWRCKFEEGDPDAPETVDMESRPSEGPDNLD